MTRLRLIAGAAILLLVLGAIVAIRLGGESAGAAKVTTRVEREHGARVAEARADERTAATVTAAIGARTARVDALADTFVQSSIQEMRDAIAAVPPAPAGAPLPAAPVDGLRDRLNTGIDRANRAADAADAPG